MRVYLSSSSCLQYPYILPRYDSHDLTLIVVMMTCISRLLGTETHDKRDTSGAGSYRGRSAVVGRARTLSTTTRSLHHQGICLPQTGKQSCRLVVQAPHACSNQEPLTSKIYEVQDKGTNVSHLVRERRFQQ